MGADEMFFKLNLEHFTIRKVHIVLVVRPTAVIIQRYVKNLVL